MSKIDEVKKTINVDEFVGYRREMHKNPATGYEEFFASNLVQKALTDMGVSFKTGFATTGVVATIEGKKNDSGKAIALRADMDALDIVEQSNQPWSSTIPGKMHGCGHDGHTATLLATAKYLSQTRNFNGTVHLIFQPAEEGMGGAYKMIEEGVLDQFPAEAYFAIHNWPWLKLGEFGTRVGPMLASSDRFTIEIKGRGGHAATPHACIDPINIGASIVQAVNSIVSREIDPLQEAVISICNFHAGGGAMNVIPETATLNGTVRTFSNDVRAHIQKRLAETIYGIGNAMGAKIEYEYTAIISPTVNTPEETQFALACAAKIGAGPIDPNIVPTMGGEDFGGFLDKRKGCYMAIGQAVADANSPHNFALHNPHYDFNDALIPIGAAYFVQLVEDYCPL